jgi:hypothetical protein
MGRYKFPGAGSESPMKKIIALDALDPYTAIRREWSESKICMPFLRWDCK